MHIERVNFSDSSSTPSFCVTGGYVCMTTRGNADNQQYKAELEKMIRSLEEEQKWSRVTVVQVEEWERAVSEEDSGYIPGAIYLYQKSL